MECKSAEYWISLYLDGALDEATEKLLFEHIEACESCRTYLEKEMEMHEQIRGLFNEKLPIGDISSSKIMDDIYKENVAFKARRLRLIPAVIVAVFALAILLIPINSKTVLAHGIDMARRLIVRQAGVVMMVEDAKTAQINPPVGGQVIYDHVDVKSLETPEEVIDMVYNAEKKPCLPEYMMEDYKFDHAIYGKHHDETGDDFYIESYYIKQGKSDLSREYVTVNLSYKKLGIFPGGFRRTISENEQAKEIAAGDEKGLLIIANEDPAWESYSAGFRTYHAFFILSKQAAELEVTYKSKADISSVEADIVKIAEPLLERIRKEVPENKGEAKNVSKVYESDKEDEFYNKITGLDDRIVKVRNIPEGYNFTQSLFIDNPKKIEIYSLPSEYYVNYKKESTNLIISMQLHTHTEKDSDFAVETYGEVIKRETLDGYIMKIYKESVNDIGNINGRSMSIDMPDYAISITIRSTGAEGQLMKEQEMKSILAGITEDIKLKAAKRQTVSLGRKIKLYDNLQQLKDSVEIKQNGFVIPAYIPENSDFLKASYVDDSYMLQFGKRVAKVNPGKRIQPVITIEMRKSDMPRSYPFADQEDTKDVIVAGRDAYIFTKISNANAEVRLRHVRFHADLIDEGFSLTITEMLNADEEVNETELIKIAESIIKQLR